MSLSIRSKILLGFVVVLLTFGGATAYAAWTVHMLGQQLRLVALGYTRLRLELQDQLTLHAQLQRRLLESPRGRGIADTVAADRKLRLARLQGARSNLAEVRKSLPKADAAFLDDVARRMEQVQRLYTENQPLFDQLYGQLYAPDPQRDPAPDLQRSIQQREEQASKLLQLLSADLSRKVLEVVAIGERLEGRAVWMTIALPIGAAGICVLVMLLVGATLRPLRRLMDSAREVAQGNYQQRVSAQSPDEIGALGREFNAMAAALQEREQRLRRSEQLAAVGKMAAQITHEVRNPLSSISLNAELLGDEVTGQNTEAQALAQAIVKEVDRLTQITEQYLALSRRPQFRLEPEDLSTMVRHLCQFHKEEMAGRGVRVEADLAGDLPLVPVDDHQLRSALLNLIRNAAEAMAGLPPADRVLLLRTRRAGPGRVAIDVVDQGPGISEEHLGRVFEPFFTTKKGGTGLGLALSHEVVAQHGGTLQVSSPPRDGGGGACFTIELPTPGL